MHLYRHTLVKAQIDIRAETEQVYLLFFLQTVHPCYAFNVSYFVSARHGGFYHIGSQKGVTQPRTRKNLYYRCHGHTDNHRILTRELSPGPLSVSRAWLRDCKFNQRGMYWIHTTSALEFVKRSVEDPNVAYPKYYDMLCCSLNALWVLCY